MNIIKDQLTFAESINFVDSIVDSCFEKDELGNDVGYSPSSLQPLIQSTFVEYYTDYEFVEDFDTNFAVYMSVKINESLSATNGKFINMTQLNGMFKAINDGIEFRKQQMLNNKKSAMDEAFESLSTLLSTLNTKAEKLDPKKLNKIINNLTPESILKAYQKSNIGDDVRNNAIETLVKENKELKNQISARNVLAKPVVAKNSQTKKSVK